MTVDTSGVATVATIATGLDSAVRVQTSNTSGSNSSTCVIGTDSRGEWKAVLLDSQLDQIAIVPVGPQQFSTQIDPIAFVRVQESSSGLWSIAGSDGSVSLVSGDGKLAERWNTGRAIDGITMYESGGLTVVAISGDQTVTAYQLTLPDAK